MNNDVVLQVGVKILLQNQAGKYLLLHRSEEKYPEASGRWDIVGGRINAGTNLMDNLSREVREETGLEIIGTPRLIAAQDILRKEGWHIVRLTYQGEAEGDIKLDVSENDDFRWCSLAELLALDDLDIYLKELLDNQSNYLIK